MQFIPMQVLEYRFTDDGITKEIIIAYQKYQGNEHLNGRISLDEEYVQSINDNLTLDRMNQAQIENFGRRKLREWIMTERPEETPTDEEEDTEATE